MTNQTGAYPSLHSMKRLGVFTNTLVFKDDKRSKTQTFAPKQAPFLDQRSLPKVHGLQPALVAQALFHLLLPVLTEVSNKPIYYNYNVFIVSCNTRISILGRITALRLHCMDIVAHKILYLIVGPT